MRHTTERPIAASDRELPKPYSNRDYDFFYRGLEQGRLLVQQCDECGALRNPPGPMCPSCRSLRWSALECRGTGTVHSYTVHHHPPLPGFDPPHAIVLAQMDEGFRLLGGFASAASGDLRIGMPLRAEFFRCGEIYTYRFRPI